MNRLEELREQIDQTDEQIIKLLNQRAELALEIKKAKDALKEDTYSPEREKQILLRVEKLAKQGRFPPESVANIFKVIISATRALMGSVAK